MSSSVKTFAVDYNPINESNVFSSGDTVTGQVTIEMSQECNVNSLWIKMKGKATVKWTENQAKTTVTYSDKEKYFSMKTQLIQEGQGDNVLRAGANTFPFTFQIPAQDLPPSFIGASGKIQYTLEANLSRSMKVDKKAKAEFTVVHKASLYSDPMLTNQQHQTTSKKMKGIPSGNVSMYVKLERTGYVQGEGISIVAVIDNKCFREMKPKYCLYKKYSYFASGKRWLETEDILKEVGENIPQNCTPTVFRTISIPPTTCPSILNCKIIKAEYRLRVNLEVKYASDPEVKFPVIVLPVLPTCNEMPSAPPAFGIDAFAPTDFGGNSFPTPPMYYDPSAPAPPYKDHKMYPRLSEFNNKY